MTFKPVAQQ